MSFQISTHPNFFLYKKREHVLCLKMSFFSSSVLMIAYCQARKNVKCLCCAILPYTLMCIRLQIPWPLEEFSSFKLGSKQQKVIIIFAGRRNHREVEWREAQEHQRKKFAQARVGKHLLILFYVPINYKTIREFHFSCWIVPFIRSMDTVYTTG